MSPAPRRRRRVYYTDLAPGIKTVLLALVTLAGSAFGAAGYCLLGHG